MVFTNTEIEETIQMFRSQKLDVRTITMGISLRSCASASGLEARRRIYDKICRYAENLVQAGDAISLEYGIPIINKRVAVTPIALVAEASSDHSYVEFAKTLDAAAKTTGVNFLGGFTSLVQKGYTRGDRILIRSIPQALAETERVCASVNVGSTQAGINMDAVRQMGFVIKALAKRTADQGGLGCTKLVVFANSVEDNPFMAGAYHGVGEPEVVINVGLSGPGVIKSALENLHGASFDTVAATIKRTAFKIPRMGELVAREASPRLGVPFGIIDLSLAPTPSVGDSVARIFQELGLEHVGAPGTTAALALLNDAVKKGGI
ncbi:MAG: DUF711 family protein, partial [Spirochaetales bacterium]|nr:DUF711 family protein [Spirochaetales bacterium]